MDAPRIIETSPVAVAVVRGRVGMAELASFFDRSFGTVFGTLGAQGVAPTGAAFAHYDAPPTDVADLAVGVPISGALTPQDGVEPWTLPAGRVATATHAGSFDRLGQSWGELMAWVGDQGEQLAGPIWEVYVTEPTPDMDPADLRTDLFALLA